MFETQEPRTAAAAPPASQPQRALYLRWRPRRFEDVVGQEHVTRTLRNAVKLDRLAHAYLFTGPRGTGKTSVARILYRAANCANPSDGDPDNSCPTCRAALETRSLDLVEIDAASNRGIDDIRDLREKVAYRPAEGRYRVYIIDEAHELTTAAWDAFLKTLEEPPAHAIFVLATTEAHKVPPTIVSRCQRFDFRRIPFDACRAQLAHVAGAEGMQIEPAVLDRLALVARGGLRDALSLLDQLGAFATAQAAIDMAIARAVLSLPSIEAVRRVLDGLSRRDAAAVMADMDEVVAGGADPRLFAEELVASLRALLLVRSRADARLTDEMPAGEAEWLRQRAPGWTVGGLIALIQQLSESLARTRDAQQFQIQVELALLGACDLPGGVTTPADPPPAAPAPPPPIPAAAPVSQPSAEPSQPVDGEDEQALPTVVQTTQGEPLPLQADDVAEPIAEPAAEVPDEQVAAEPPDEHTAAHQLAAVQARWADVVEAVTARKRMLGVLMSSAQPIGVEEGGERLVVGFGSDFNLKRAELAANRQAIEEGVRHVFGRPYRLRCTLAATGGSPLLEDPVINYAVRAFGGQPRRLADSEAEPTTEPTQSGN
jgi:DNA polymerase III subunit gamma/tau